MCIPTCYANSHTLRLPGQRCLNPKATQALLSTPIPQAGGRPRRVCPGDRDTRALLGPPLFTWFDTRNRRFLRDFSLEASKHCNDVLFRLVWKGSASRYRCAVGYHFAVHGRSDVGGNEIPVRASRGRSLRPEGIFGRGMEAEYVCKVAAKEPVREAEELGVTFLSSPVRSCRWWKTAVWLI